MFIDFVEGERLALCASDAIIEEVRDVLGRPQGRESYTMIKAFSEYDFLDFQVRNREDFRLPVLAMLRSITK